MTTKKIDSRRIVARHNFPPRPDVLEPEPPLYVDVIANAAAQSAVKELEALGAFEEAQARQIIRAAVKRELEGDAEALLNEGYRRRELLDKQAEGRRQADERRARMTKADHIRELAARQQTPAQIATTAGCSMSYVSKVLRAVRPESL